MDQYHAARYWGYDISNTIVARNQEIYGLPRVQFFPMTSAHILPCDLLLCVDVLFHVIGEDDYQAILQMLKDARWRYLAVTAYEYEGPSAAHLKIRKFDPSFFGPPVLRKVIEEEGSLYLYLWER
jgi:hypothetical protein